MKDRKFPYEDKFTLFDNIVSLFIVTSDLDAKFDKYQGRRAGA